tara:strand:+ start:20738 stop:20929 length:192 start_codon:yes stop_codon:yes gene_type:complete
MPNPCDWPWQFQKINGVWHRRRANTNERWRAIVVERVSVPPFRKAHKRGDKIAPPSINRWTWK